MNTEVSAVKPEYWVSRGNKRLLTYAGPSLQKNLPINEVRELVNRKGALGAMWTYDCDCPMETEWYEVICDMNDYCIDKIKSSTTRSYVRRGLKKCIVRRVDYEYLADNGYEVYLKASSRYRNFAPQSKEDFREYMLRRGSAPGSELLGVFIDVKLVAYALVLIRGNTVEVCISKFDPAHSKARPMYALQYRIVEHYLNERGYKEIYSGTRPLMHETNIVDFLLHLGYRKRYGRLGMYLSRPVRVALRLARTFRKICKLALPSRHYAILESLLLAQDIKKATRKRSERG